jgi:uncharacterized protein involved in exopolysaccharide biosynthesis
MSPVDNTAAVSVKDLAQVLIRRRLQLSLIFILIFAGVCAGTFLMPKQYESRMKILVKNERPEMIVSPDSGGGAGYQTEVSETQINSEIELLNSDNLLQQVVTKCGLDRLPIGASGPVRNLPAAIQKATMRLQRSLKISPVRKANIILVEYSATDPQLAAAVLRQLAELYLEAHLRIHGTPGSYEFFARQTERYRDGLRDAETKLADFRQRENIVLLAQQKETALQKSSDSESALLQADTAIGEYRQKIADTRAQLAAAAPRITTQSRTISNQYSVERLHTMLAELQNRRTQLLMKFRPDDRTVLEADQELADTRSALAEATKLTGGDQATDVNPLRQALEIDLAKEQAELAGIEGRREALVEEARIWRHQLATLNNATAGFEDLTRNQKEAEDNYLLYAKKTEEARIAESLDQQKIANVAIAETPSVPYVPSKPNVPLNVALGAILACFISVGGVFAAEYFRDETVEGPSDLEELTGLPVLAIAYGS